MLSSANCKDARLRKELTVPAPILPGKSSGARKIQQYLHVNGIKVAIDGDWGVATQSGLDTFFKTAVGSVDQAKMDVLGQPLLRAVEDITPQATLNQSIVLYAKQQLKEHPIEIGGPNAGPWVRLYMDGNEGEDWLWCAGFVTYIVRYCARLHALPYPVPRTYSCDTLGMSAKSAGKYHSKGSLAAIPPGSIFLVPKAPLDWSHTGLVLEDHGATIVTAEANTDSAGSSNGWEATSRIRNAANVDIVLI